jgi:hypothetical protein
MMNVREAVRWSKSKLKEGGVFAIDDYVGATLNQHSDALVEWGSELMASLPERLRRHWNGKDIMPPFIGRADLEELKKIDPYEYADSASILAAVEEIFPGCEIIKTGGAAYFVALMHTFHNFMSKTDIALLNVILNADREASNRVESQYAVVIGQKPHSDGSHSFDGRVATLKIDRERAP